MAQIYIKVMYYSEEGEKYFYPTRFPQILKKDWVKKFWGLYGKSSRKG
jgi:hypothetical protein